MMVCVIMLFAILEIPPCMYIAPPKKATRQSSGFGHKKREVKHRKGGEVCAYYYLHSSHYAASTLVWPYD